MTVLEIVRDRPERETVMPGMRARAWPRALGVLGRVAKGARVRRRVKRVAESPDQVECGRSRAWRVSRRASAPSHMDSGSERASTMDVGERPNAGAAAATKTAQSGKRGTLFKSTSRI